MQESSKVLVLSKAMLSGGTSGSMLTLATVFADLEGLKDSTPQHRPEPCNSLP